MYGWNSLDREELDAKELGAISSTQEETQARFFIRNYELHGSMHR